MKTDPCQAAQNRIFALPDPRQVPDPLRSHLDGCASCRRWWAGVGQLERLLAGLPAPPPAADRKALLLDELTSAGPVIRSVPAAVPHDRFRLPAGVWKPLAAVAAAGLAVGGAWVLVKGSGKPNVTQAAAPRHPLLESVVKRDVALSRAGTPADRLRALGDMADDLQTEARDLARVANPDELRDLARWYDRVVREGLVKQAAKLPVHALPPAEKVALLDALAARLAASGTAADELAKEAPPGAKEPLRRISEAAREGHQRLTALAHGEGA